jgi:hypothetical protein
LPYKPPGPDARARQAAKDARRRDEEAETRRKYGPDLGELEPCPYCGRSLCAPPTCPADPMNEEPTITVGEPHQPWHALRQAVLDNHRCRDTMSAHKRARFDAVCEDLWAKHADRGDAGIETAGVLARAALDVICDEPDPERNVVCEGCGEIIETEPIPAGDTDADRLIPADECGLCGPGEDA